MRSGCESRIWPFTRRLGRIALAVAVAGSVAHAQEQIHASEPVAVPQSGPGAGAIEINLPVGLLCPLPRRDLRLGLAEWDHTLLGAFQLGARLFRLSYPAAAPAALGSPMAPAAVLRFSAFGPAPKASLDAIARALRVDQLQRQGMNLNLKSAYGNFRLQYREVFNARANSLGGGVGQASAAATFTSPRFGAGGMWDFSAAALYGTGSINQLLGTGFGNSNIGGNGPALRKSEGPTVAIKLTF